jgi:hypothetical protein
VWSSCAPSSHTTTSRPRQTHTLVKHGMGDGRYWLLASCVFYCTLNGSIITFLIGVYVTKEDSLLPLDVLFLYLFPLFLAFFLLLFEDLLVIWSVLLPTELALAGRAAVPHCCAWACLHLLDLGRHCSWHNGCACTDRATGWRSSPASGSTRV